MDFTYIIIGVLIAVCIYYIYRSIYKEKFDENYESIYLGETKYYINKTLENSDEALKKLKDIKDEINKLFNILRKKYPDDYRIKNFNKRWKSKEFYETTPGNGETSYTINKGLKTAFCLRDTNTEKIHNDRTLMFVVIHELSHVISDDIGHTNEFWDNFKWLLNQANEYLLFPLVNYKNNPVIYCGVTINDNPFYDWNCTDKTRCEK